MTAARAFGRVLVVGAAGFVGRALCPALSSAGAEVVAGLRRLDDPLTRRDAVRCDVDDDASVASALRGAEVAVFLVHGLRRRAYAAWERDRAARFAAACARAGVRRIVYLGGVASPGGSSPHLRSRHATGDELRSAGVPVVELRAPLIVGADSESWRLVRDAAARLPLMLSPPWLSARVQPVAIDDVVAALSAAARTDDAALPPGIYDVPGPEALSGRDILSRIAALLGRRVTFLDVPFAPRRLAARVAPWVTRTDARVAAALLGGAGLELTVAQPGVFATAALAQVRRTSFDEAARRALGAERISVLGRAVEAAAGALSRRLG